MSSTVFTKLSTNLQHYYQHHLNSRLNSCILKGIPKQCRSYPVALFIKRIPKQRRSCPIALFIDRRRELQMDMPLPNHLSNSSREVLDKHILCCHAFKKNYRTSLRALTTRIRRYYINRCQEENQLCEILMLKSSDSMVEKAHSRLTNSRDNSL